MGAERRGAPIPGWPMTNREGGANGHTQTVPDTQAVGPGRLAPGEGESWRSRGRRPEYCDVRGRPGEQPVQDLEPHVVGKLLPPTRKGGGNTEESGRVQNPRGAHCSRPRGPNGREANPGAHRGTRVPPGLLRLPARTVRGTGRWGLRASGAGDTTGCWNSTSKGCSTTSGTSS